MFSTGAEHNIGLTKCVTESICYHSPINRCASATRSLDALRYCFRMLITESPTLIIRWCRVRLSGGPPEQRRSLIATAFYFLRFSVNSLCWLHASPLLEDCV